MRHSETVLFFALFRGFALRGGGLPPLLIPVFHLAFFLPRRR